MAKLLDIATQAQDKYFQDYPSNDSFFDIEDFKDYVASTYSGMLNAMFQVQRKMVKGEDGFSNVEIPPQWTLPNTLEVKYDKELDKYYAETEWPIFAFDFDAHAYALQPLKGLSKHCNNQPCKYRRITLYEAQFQDVIPPVGIVMYYLNSAKEIVFLGAREGAKVLAHYIPQVVGADDDCLLSDNITKELIDATVKSFFEAKNGNFVDKTNDQNPNNIPQQQVNPALGK
jgi:hypothetical protein